MLGMDRRSGQVRGSKYHNKRGVERSGNHTAISGQRGGRSTGGLGPPKPLLVRPAPQPTTKYFIIKATNHHSIDVSLETGLWQFGNQTEKKLKKSHRVGQIVYNLRFGNFQSMTNECLCGGLTIAEL